MTTLAVGAAVAGVLTIVRDDILSIGVSNGLTLLSSVSTSAPELKGQLEEMDIEAMLRTVEAVVNEVETDFNKHKKPAAAAPGSGSVDSLDSTASTASTTAAAAAAAAKEGGKEVDGGWVAVAPGTGAAEAKSASATAATSPTAGAAAAAGVVSPAIAQGSGPKWTARKKSSLLHCTGNAAVALAIDQLEDAVSKVHAVLQELEREATAQNAKWFSAWRSNGFAPLMDRLRALQAVLDKRLDLLLKVLSLKSLTTQHVTWHAQAHANAQPQTGSLAPAPAAADKSAPAAAAAAKAEPAVAAVATAKAPVKLAAAKK